jgi:hypothetical protein
MKKYFHEKKIKKTLGNCLRMLAYLQQAFFVNYLEKDYIKRKLHYQRVLNAKTKAFFRAIIKASDLINSTSKYWDIFCKINHLSEIIFSLNQLRFRVDDYTTFKICTRELQAIEALSVKIFLQLALLFFKKNTFDISSFEEKIHDFEGIYNRTLQIVSVDPLVFMFFIQDLYALYDEMKNLQQAISLNKTVSQSLYA